MSMKHNVCLSLMLALTACGSPVREVNIEELGPEAEGFPPGPAHRPGQPCVLCHSETGGAEPVYSVAGTLFFESVKNGVTTLELTDSNFTIFVQDSEGVQQQIPVETDNCGNFFIEKSVFDPSFPLRTEIRNSDGTLLNRMNSRIGRDGSCGGCHVNPKGPFSPGPVYVSSNDPTPERADGCPLPQFARLP